MAEQRSNYKLESKMKTLSATLLPSGPRVQPEPTLVENTAESIQSIIGGYFAVVKAQVENEDGDSCVVVGYVHDEGLLLDMDLNYLATALFHQELHGPCLLVSGTNPDTGEYDGECYDLPIWVWEGISTDLVHRTASTYNKAQLLGFGLRHAVAQKFCSEQELRELMKTMMAQCDNDELMLTQQQRQLVEVLISWAQTEMYRTAKLSEDESFIDSMMQALLDYEEEKEGE